MSWLFVATQFLLSMNISSRENAMEWKGNPKYLHEKSFSKFYCNICHTYINLLVYNGLMVAVDPISIITLLSPIATP